MSKVQKITDRNQRAAFWRFCISAERGSLYRARKAGLPHEIDRYWIDEKLVDQGWRCAVSGMALIGSTGKPHPFSPSLDRIVPALGYVPDNVSVVCLMVNLAINEWGLVNFLKLVACIRETRVE